MRTKRSKVNITTDGNRCDRHLNMKTKTNVKRNTTVEMMINENQDASNSAKKPASKKKPRRADGKIVGLNTKAAVRRKRKIRALDQGRQLSQSASELERIRYILMEACDARIVDV